MPDTTTERNRRIDTDRNRGLLRHAQTLSSTERVMSSLRGREAFEAAIRLFAYEASRAEFDRCNKIQNKNHKCGLDLDDERHYLTCYMPWSVDRHGEVLVYAPATNSDDIAQHRIEDKLAAKYGFKIVERGFANDNMTFFLHMVEK
jgi:hypothetical protein